MFLLIKAPVYFSEKYLMNHFVLQRNFSKISFDVKDFTGGQFKFESF